MPLHAADQFTQGFVEGGFGLGLCLLEQGLGLRAQLFQQGVQALILSREFVDALDLLQARGFLASQHLHHLLELFFQSLRPLLSLAAQLFQIVRTEPPSAD